MKIALIDPSMFTWPYDSALADGLRAGGHQVTLYTKFMAKGEQGKGSSYVKEFFYPGLQMSFAKQLPKKLFLALKGLMHISGMVGLLAKLIIDRPDVIHFQWAPLPAIDRLLIPLFRKIAPVVLTVHDSSPFNNNPSSRLQALGSIKIMSAFDRLIVHTDHARERLMTYGLAPEKVVRIAHGVLDSGFKIAPAAIYAKNPDTPVTLLLFGKLKPYKGADILIRAMGALPAATLSKCALHIVGKAEMDIQPLKVLASELGVASRIEWDLRFVDDAEMAGIFQQADIMTVPYREIDASGVLMVALALGKPIVASNIGLFAELLQDGKHGYLITPEDYASLALALGKLIDDPVLRQQMGSAVHDLNKSIPTWNQIADTTVQLYQSLPKAA